MNATLATLLAAVASAAVTVAAEAAPQPSPSAQGSAIVVQDQASLRAAPRDGAQQQASLWQGEVLEVRGERLDYLQVWDHKRERGGFIRASDVRRVALTEAEGPALLAVMRFVQDTPGAEALGIADKVGSLAVGLEADLCVLDLHSTPLIDFRMQQADSLDDVLFVQMMLADDRAVAATWVAGRCVYSAAAA
mgnify:FL=1